MPGRLLPSGWLRGGTEWTHRAPRPVRYGRGRPTL